jgi:hypothetical protein
MIAEPPISHGGTLEGGNGPLLLASVEPGKSAEPEKPEKSAQLSLIDTGRKTIPVAEQTARSKAAFGMPLALGTSPKTCVGSGEPNCETGFRTGFERTGGDFQEREKSYVRK